MGIGEKGILYDPSAFDHLTFISPQWRSIKNVTLKIAKKSVSQNGII